MEIQHISGPDVVPRGVSVQNPPEPEAERVENNTETKTVNTVKEESKGNYIDVHA